MDIFWFLAVGCALIGTSAAVKLIYSIGKASNLYKLRSSRYLLAAALEAYFGTALNTVSQSIKNNWVFFCTVLLINLAIYHLLCWSALIWTGEKVKYGNVFARPKVKNFLGLSIAYTLIAFWLAGDDFNKIWVGDGAAIATNFWLWTARLAGLSFGTVGVIILFFEIIEEGKRRKDTTRTWSAYSLYAYLIIVVCSILFLGTGLIRIILYKFLSSKITFDILSLFGYISFLLGLTLFTIIVLFDKKLMPIYEMFSQARCRILLGDLKNLYIKAAEKFPVGYRVDPYQLKSPRYALVALVENLNDIRRNIWRTEAWRVAEEKNIGVAEVTLKQFEFNEAELWVNYLENNEKSKLFEKYNARISPEGLVPEIKTSSIEQAADYFVGIAKQVFK